MLCRFTFFNDGSTTPPVTSPNSFVGFLHNPEWVAALALIIQALFLFLQWLILLKHGHTMEEHAEVAQRHSEVAQKHAEIAQKQSETAALIGKALDQQGSILDEQTKIMNEQLTFQRQMATQAERTAIMNLVINVQGRLIVLDAQLARMTSSSTPGDRQQANRLFDELAGAVSECQKTVFLSLHLTERQEKYFAAFCEALASLASTGDNAKDFKSVHALKEKYGDLAFYATLGSLGRIEDNGKPSPS